MIKSVVFDLDGTLLNTINSIKHYLNRALAENGLETVDEETVKILAGKGAKDLIQKGFKNGGIILSEEELNEKTAIYVADYDKDPCYLTEVYDGIREMVSALKEKGIKIAILSNKPNSSVNYIVPKFFGEGFFDKVLGATEDLPRKPNPEALFEILKELDSNPEECLFVGDSGVDMETGKNAGALACGVLWGFRGLEELKTSGADYIVSHPSEILDII